MLWGRRWPTPFAASIHEVTILYYNIGKSDPQLTSFIITTMESSFGYYIFILLAVVVGVLVIKKVASCLIRTVVTLALVLLLVYVYFTFIAPTAG